MLTLPKPMRAHGLILNYYRCETPSVLFRHWWLGFLSLLWVANSQCRSNLDRVYRVLSFLNEEKSFVFLQTRLQSWNGFNLWKHKTTAISASRSVRNGKTHDKGQSFVFYYSSNWCIMWLIVASCLKRWHQGLWDENDGTSSVMAIINLTWAPKEQRESHQQGDVIRDSQKSDANDALIAWRKLLARSSGKRERHHHDDRRWHCHSPLLYIPVCLAAFTPERCQREEEPNSVVSASHQ